MATNPNKVGSIAYDIWEKNQKPVASTTVVSQPTASQIATGNGEGGAYGTKTSTQLKAEYDAKMNPVTATPTTTAPTSTVTPSKSTALSGYKFGNDAMVANSKDNTYLSTRNTAYANDYSTKGLKDYNSVYNELNKDIGFQSASQADKDGTTKSIWGQMQKTAVTPTSNTVPVIDKTATVNTKIGDETYSSVDYDARIKQYDDILSGAVLPPDGKPLDDTTRRLTEQAREEQIRLKNNEAQATSNYNADAKYVKDSNQGTLDDNKRNYDEQAVDLNRKLEAAKLSTDRQIEDVRKMTERNIAHQEKSGALSGINRSSSFTQGLNNIKQDSLDTINRLQADLETYNASVGLAKSSALQTFNDNKNRAIEKFTNQYKDLLNNTNTDLQKAMGKFPDFSDEKLKKQLAIIKEGYYASTLTLGNQWLQSMKTVNDEARAESDQIMKLEQFANLKEDRLLTQWAGADGEGYLTLTQKDLQGLVDSGQIKPSTAMASFNLMKSKAQNTINALASNGVATPEETQAVMDAINNNMSAQDAIAKVVAANPSRFVKVSNTQDWQKLSDGSLYNQRTGQIKNLDGTTTTSSGYQGPVIPPVAQQVVETNIQSIQSIENGSQGGQCGSFVNNYLGKLGLSRLFEDPITQKEGLSNSNTPKVGSIFITDSEQFPQYGHVGIVTKVNADGSFETKESNKAGEGQVFSRTMQPGQAKYGFFDPTLGKQPSANGGFSDEVMNKAKSIMNGSSTFKLTDLPVGERALVAQAVNTLKDQAKSSGDIVGLMKASAGGTTPSAEERKAISKAYSSLSQIDTLTNKLGLKNAEIIDPYTKEKIDMSPLTGWIREKNPRDTDAQEIKALLTSTIPGLARGIYGEVGVLTDQDVELYKQTIPNLKQTDAVKKAVIGLTYRTIRNAIKSNMEVLAGSSVDVSGLADQYKAIDDKIIQIEKDLGVSGQSTNNSSSNSNGSSSGWGNGR